MLGSSSERARLALGLATRNTGGIWFSSCLCMLLASHFTLGAQQGDRGLEVVEAVERLVDAGESQVGDLVELAQRSQDGQPDLVGVDLGAAL